MSQGANRAGLYMRRSREDGRGESGGIEGQRQLLRSYAQAHGFTVCGEYADDGYSGTHFDRPGFQRMQEDIEAGLLDAVLVKDLSRLGRNYLASGELTEVYFPRHGVRLVAINDGYDSEAGEDDMAPFRHVMNELYARDISKKIRSALHTKMVQGQYIGSFAPYGYRKSEENKNRLIPDEEAAAVVRRVFALAAEGRRATVIAEELNRAEIPVPLDYRRQRAGKPPLGSRWTASGVCKLLSNTVYLGHTVQGKNRKPSFRAGKSQGCPRAQWIVVEHTHEPLVGKELFERARHRGRG